MTGRGMTGERILRYLATELSVDVAGIEEDTALFSTGRVDSFALVDLIGFLEQETGVVFGPMDISLEHLDTVGRMLAFLASRRG